MLVHGLHALPQRPFRPKHIRRPHWATPHSAPWATKRRIRLGRVDEIIHQLLAVPSMCMSRHGTTSSDSVPSSQKQPHSIFAQVYFQIIVGYILTDTYERQRKKGDVAHLSVSSSSLTKRKQKKKEKKTASYLHHRRLLASEDHRRKVGPH